MHCIICVLCLLVWWPGSLFEVEGRLTTTQYVLPRLLEERSSEGRLTLVVRDDIVLDLEKTSAFADNFDFVQLGEHTNLFEEMSSSRFRGDVYKDDRFHAAVLVSQEDGLRIKGILGGSLRIQHLENAVPNQDGSVLHSLNEIEHNTFDGIESQLLDNNIVTNQQAERRSNEDAGNILSARAAGVSATVTVKKITVETRVVVSSRYAAAFKSSDYSHVNNLFDYLRVLFAFVNVVCAQFKKNVLDLQVKVVGVVLLQETTETFMHKFSSVDALYPDTLDRFNTFIKKKSSVFVKDDIVVYLTPYRIGRQQSDGTVDQAGAGLAGLGAACTDHRGSLVTDIPKEFTGIYNIVHEMLHLLGSAHDGEKAPYYLKNSPGGTTCAGQGDSVMSPVHTGNKKLTFSICTQRQVLAYLTNPRGHCLITQVTRYTQVVSMEKMFVNRQKYCQRMVKDIPDVKFHPYLDEKNDIKKCVLMCSWKRDYKLNVRLRSAPNYTPCLMKNHKVIKMCLWNNCTSVLKQLLSPVAAQQQKL
uniref:Putative tick metalloprotease 1 n=1 Tax=Amblyomma triste TaxID=251400 RepID=A0A023GE82_AMBTT